MRFFTRFHRAFLCALIVSVFIFVVGNVVGDDLDTITKQLGDLKIALDSSQKATATNENNLQNLLTQLNEIKRKITILEADIAQKEADIVKGEAALSKQKKLLEERAVSYYKNVQNNTIQLTDFIFSNNLSESLRNFFYQKSLVDEDKKNIVKIVLYVKAIEDRKAQLQTQKDRLAILKKDVDTQSVFLASEVVKAKQYQAQLSQQIAVLTAQQQQILAQKLSGLNISRSANTAGKCDSDLTNGRDPGFSPKFAFFTFGVPNRVGMNQYGAKGRANKGEGYESILRAYYNYDSFQDFDGTIRVNNGNGINQGSEIWNGNLEDYVKRVYEVPGDWPSNALKAQVIAARSYVLAATNRGKDSICANEYCQAFQTNAKGGAWEQAVNDTAKKVMVQGGNPIKAWFSSTHGGYVFSSGEIGWSSTSWTKHATDFSGSVNSFDDLKNNAYDKDSPWFYCDWGSRSDYAKTAWLKPQEIADIVNVILLARKDSSTSEHLYQPDKPNPIGKETWSPDRVKQELGGSAYNTIDSVSVSADFGGGRTTTISVSGDGKSDSFPMNEFKDYFNLRAPANIQIVGPLFNVEKR